MIKVSNILYYAFNSYTLTSQFVLIYKLVPYVYIVNYVKSLG